MKSILLKAITLIIPFALYSANVLAFYSDIPPEHEYYVQIKTLYDLGRLPEEPNNLFRPDDLLKRPDLYKLIIKFGQVKLSPKVSLPFIDTENNADYAPYLQTALDLDILEPIGLNPEFFPDLTISKHSVLSKMFKILGIGTGFFFDKENFAFSDLSPNSQTATIAVKASELGILEKDQPDKFKMARRITRAEAADYLHKIYQYSPTGLTIKPTTVTINLNNVTESDSESNLLDNQTFTNFLEIWNALHDKYLYRDDLNDDQLIYGAIEGMVDQVDDEYTAFEQPEDAENLISSLNGDYEGIGIIIEIIDNNITVVSPFKDSPAEEAGIKASDIIIKVDGKSVVGDSLSTVANKIKGPSGSTVKITVLREGTEKTLEVVREFIFVSSVKSEIKTYDGKKIAYISIMNFGDSTYSEFVEAAENLMGEKPAGFIIDLRNNPGGFLDVSVNLISLFTKESKTAVKLVYSNSTEETYKTNGNGLLDGYKIVVLVNGGSASASEIMAGALQDYEIATLIGEKTFGKGSVQELKQFSDNSLFKYTISKWLTPDGREINNIGLTPDKVIENSVDTDNQLNTALAQF